MGLGVFAWDSSCRAHNPEDSRFKPARRAIRSTLDREQRQRSANSRADTYGDSDCFSVSRGIIAPSCASPPRANPSHIMAHHTRHRSAHACSLFPVKTTRSMRPSRSGQPPCAAVATLLMCAREKANQKCREDPHLFGRRSSCCLVSAVPLVHAQSYHATHRRFGQGAHRRGRPWGGRRGLRRWRKSP